MANKTTKSRPLNLFDFILILLAILCVVVIVFKYVFIKNDTFTETVNVSFVVDGIMDITANNILENTDSHEEIFLNSNGESIGFIESIEKKNSVLYVSNGSNIELVNDPLKYDLFGTATLYGKQGANYFLVNGSIELKLDTTIVVYTNTAIFQMRITAFN